MPDKEIVRLPRSYFKVKCRRYIPKPSVLAARMQRVFEIGKEMKLKDGRPLYKQDPKDGTAALHDRIMKTVQMGYLSDSPGVQLYYRIRKTTKGWTQYKCARGSSALEGWHFHLRSALQGFTMGAALVDAIVVELQVRWNMKSGVKNRRDASFGVHDPELLDDLWDVVQGLQVLELDGYARTRQVADAELEDMGVGRPLAEDDPLRERMASQHASGDAKPARRLTKPAAYLCAKWRLPTMVTPVRTREESVLFCTLLNAPDVLVCHKGGVSIDFARLVARWNAHVLSALASAHTACNLFLKSERLLKAYWERVRTAVAVSQSLQHLAPTLRQLNRDHNHPVKTGRAAPPPTPMAGGLPSGLTPSKPSGAMHLNFAASSPLEDLVTDPLMEPGNRQGHNRCTLCNVPDKFNPKSGHTKKGYCPKLDAYPRRSKESGDLCGRFVPGQKTSKEKCVGTLAWEISGIGLRCSSCSARFLDPQMPNSSRPVSTPPERPPPCRASPSSQQSGRANCKAAPSVPPPPHTPQEERVEAPPLQLNRPKKTNPLTEAEMHWANTCLVEGDALEKFNEVNEIPVIRGKARCLDPNLGPYLGWLNDEVINFILELLKARSGSGEGLPNAHFFSTHFYTKLASDGYAAVRRWTGVPSKGTMFDLFSMDLVVVPIHLGNHWALAVIDFRNDRRGLYYYDSIGFDGTAHLDRLREYLHDESLDKRRASWEDKDFKTCPKAPMPKQGNGWDCGVFMLEAAARISKNEELDFNQTHMNFIRKRLLVEIKNGQLHGERRYPPGPSWLRQERSACVSIDLTSEKPGSSTEESSSSEGDVDDGGKEHSEEDDDGNKKTNQEMMELRKKMRLHVKRIARRRESREEGSQPTSQESKKGLKKLLVDKETRRIEDELMKARVASEVETLMDNGMGPIVLPKKQEVAIPMVSDPDPSFGASNPCEDPSQPSQQLANDDGPLPTQAPSGGESSVSEGDGAICSKRDATEEGVDNLPMSHAPAPATRAARAPPEPPATIGAGDGHQAAPPPSDAPKVVGRADKRRRQRVPCGVLRIDLLKKLARSKDGSRGHKKVAFIVEFFASESGSGIGNALLHELRERFGPDEVHLHVRDASKTQHEHNALQFYQKRKFRLESDQRRWLHEYHPSGWPWRYMRSDGESMSLIAAHLRHVCEFEVARTLSEFHDLEGSDELVALAQSVHDSQTGGDGKALEDNLLAPTLVGRECHFLVAYSSSLPPTETAGGVDGQGGGESGSDGKGDGDHGDGFGSNKRERGDSRTHNKVGDEISMQGQKKRTKGTVIEEIELSMYRVSLGDGDEPKLPSRRLLQPASSGEDDDLQKGPKRKIAETQIIWAAVVEIGRTVLEQGRILGAVESNIYKVGLHNSSQQLELPSDRLFVPLSARGRQRAILHLSVAGQRVWVTCRMHGQTVLMSGEVLSPIESDACVVKLADGDVLKLPVDRFVVPYESVDAGSEVTKRSK